MSRVGVTLVLAMSTMAVAVAVAVASPALAEERSRNPADRFHVSVGGGIVPPAEWPPEWGVVPMPIIADFGARFVSSRRVPVALNVSTMVFSGNAGSGNPEDLSTQDPSWLTTALLGVEWQGMLPNAAGPLVFLGTGLSRLAAGATYHQYTGLSPRTIRGHSFLRPAVSAALRLRVPRRDPSLPCMQFAARVIHIPDGRRGLTVVPVLLGLSF